MEEYYKYGPMLRKHRTGAFYLVGTEPKPENEVSRIVAQLKKDGFCVKPVSERNKANAAIRTFQGPIINDGKDKKRYCGVRLYFADYWSGNLTADDGSDNGEPWCINEQEVYVNLPEIENGLYFKADFTDEFFWIEKDDNA